MTLEHALLVACLVLAVLAITAWAASWKTMEWLDDAEDLIERAQRIGGYTRALRDYKRRTPRRSR